MVDDLRRNVDKKIASLLMLLDTSNHGIICESLEELDWVGQFWTGFVLSSPIGHRRWCWETIAQCLNSARVQLFSHALKKLHETVG